MLSSGSPLLINPTFKIGFDGVDVAEMQQD